MIQIINKLRKFLIPRPGISSPSNRGQTAVVLILMIAIALVIYSASLNWGRVAQYKTLTTVASNTAAANMATMITSYGEQQLQVTLGGRKEICKRTGLFALIISLIFSIIVLVITWNPAAAAWTFGMTASAIAVVMNVAAIVIHLTVVEPGLTRVWNKMQKDLPFDGQVIEGAIQVGMQGSVSDPSLISDHFDMDSDGLWVDSIDSGNIPQRVDKISRFAYYYTKRLQLITPPRIDEIENFVIGLSELVYENPFNKVGPTACTPAELAAGAIACQVPDNFGLFDPVCAGGAPAPYCDPCCQPEFLPDGVTRLRPETCTAAQVAACGDGDYPVGAYLYQYDPFRENFNNTFFSFREQFGIDDENISYNRNPTNPNTPPPQLLAAGPTIAFRKEDSTGYYTAAVQTSLGIVGGTPDRRQGIFPFLWSMSALKPVQEMASITPVLPIIPKSDSVIMMTADPTTCTVLTCPNNVVAPSNQCASVLAFDTGTGRPRTDGFYWKPGSDEYCSNAYPYNDCVNRIGNCADGSFPGAPPTCGCPASDNPNAWHDDYMDVLVFEFKQFLVWATEFLRNDLGALNKDFESWYPGAAYWIAPKCSAAADCDNSASADPECHYCNLEENDGMLLFWRDTLGGWVDLLDTWLYRTSFANDANWCLPTAAAVAAAATPQTTLLQIEKNAIPSLQAATPIPVDRNGVNILPAWGDLNDTVACLNFNLNNVPKLTNCQANCLANPTDHPGNANVCLNLPRSVVDFKNSSTVVAENTEYQTAQRIQDCLSSTCMDSFGVTLPVCIGLPVATPPNCTAFAPGNAFYDALTIERNTRFDLSNYCEPAVAITTSFQDNVNLAIQVANVQAAGLSAQEPGLIARATELNQLRDQALAARTALLNGYTHLNDFLRPCAPGLPLGQGCANCSAGGPAAQLICARRAFVSSPEDYALPNFAIYGWQSDAVSGRGPTGTDPDKGYWHIVRVEAFAPKRCYDQCEARRLPWVRTWTKGGFLNRQRCYGLWDTNGITIARVTRYDEDHDSPGARLGNSQLLWKFRFTNPGVLSNAVPANVLSTDCRHPASYDNGVSPSTRLALDGAFMINNIPSKDPNVSPACWDMVNDLLDRGVQTTTCARYYYDSEVNHMSLKFTECDQAKVDFAVNCAASGTCP